MPPKKGPLSREEIGDFHSLAALYGSFMILWATFELLIEIAIMRELNLSPRDTSITVGGLGFGAKVEIFFSLMAKSETNSNKSKKVREFQNIAKRNALVHSFPVLQGRDYVLIRREVKGNLIIKRTRYNERQLYQHVSSLSDKLVEVQNELKITDDDIDEYTEHMIVGGLN